MKTQLMIATIALTFSLSAIADGGNHAVDHSKMDHSNMTPAQMEAMNNQEMDHSKMDHSKMTMPQIQAMKKSMHGEMIKIINTVDINERKKRYVAHQNSMQALEKAMMNMMKQCMPKQ